MKKIIFKIISLASLFALIFNLAIPVSAANTSNSNYKILNNTFSISDEVITEEISFELNNNLIVIEKSTFKNNTVILDITENGKTTIIETNGNYNQLKNFFTVSPIQQSPLTRSPIYNNTRFVTTFNYSGRYNFTNHEVASIIGILSNIAWLAPNPIGVITAIAVGIYEFLVTMEPEDDKIYITTSRNWFEVLNVGGVFLGYYTCSQYSRFYDINNVYLGNSFSSFQSTFLY